MTPSHLTIILNGQFKGLRIGYIEYLSRFSHSFSVSVIMEITYGHRIVSDDDPYIKIAEGVNHISTQSGTPGMTPVDIFPLRKLSKFFYPQYES